MAYKHVGPFSETDPNMIEDFGCCCEPFDRTCESCEHILADDEPGPLCENCKENLADGDTDGRSSGWGGEVIK